MAEQLFQESLTIFRDLGNEEGMAASLRDLGYVLWILGEYGAAKQLHQESLTLRQQIGHQKGIADSLDFLAHDAMGLEEYGEAKKLWQESFTIYREIGNPWGMAWALGNRGELANVLGEHAEAFHLAQESLALFKKIDARRGISWSLKVLGDAACGLGDLAAAKRHFRQALETVVLVGVASFAPLTLVGIAALMAAEGERERALELLTLVLHQPIAWQWVEDRAAPLVAELEAELPADVVVAAWERGRARDLDATVAELLDELGGTGTDSPDQSPPSR
jgi:tetratricopeptide (TPR) repeat protein